MQKENIIISLGGSLVAPNDIDVGFLKNFRHSIVKYLNPEIKPLALNGASSNPSALLRARRFFVFVGGGKVCRNYQKALSEFGADNKEKDWIGINVSRLNAEVVKQSFDKICFDKVITDPTKKVNSRRDLVVFAGWKPGWSTDYCSVALAKNMGIKTIINLTNIDYIYDKDPNKFPNAKPLKEINWREFRKLVGDKWAPGLSMPFDPRASKMAEILKIKVIMVNGKHLERLEDFLNSKPFLGTIIQ